ncbi:MAG: endonuclease MutS2 [Clostridia bacterium]|nr:endonuclease MutS2 [Clostridia bacterium]
MDRNLKILEFDSVRSKLASHAVCDDARELCAVLEPFFELSECRVALAQTEAAHVLLAKFGSPPFAAAANVDSRLAFAQAGGSLGMRDLLEVKDVLRLIRTVSDWRFNSPGSSSALDSFFSSLMPQKQLEDEIGRCIIDDETMSDHASAELANIRRKKNAAEASIRTRLEAVIKSAGAQGFLQESIITTRNGRYVVPVKIEHRGSVKGLVHDTSGSGATVFIEPMSVVEANNEILVLAGKEQQEIARILSELSASVGSLCDVIKHNYHTVVELDMVFAKAKLAYAMKATVPVLNDEREIYLRQARHPLLDPDTVVPTDIQLGCEFDTLVITGPNTGGKTVTLKTIGLLTAMAQAGLMIPAAENSKVAFFEHICADIGDEQSIEQSLSTFSSHMVNIINILSIADETTLVLIDELGAGTDPVEGAALASAILEELRFKGAVVAATTHYAELKAYALETDGVENACCEFDVTTLRPTYRLLIGAPGKSNAFAITARLGLGEDVIERAKGFISAENSRFEQMVSSLETRRAELERSRDEVRANEEQSEKLKADAKKKLDEADEIFKRETDRAKQEALKITENARRQANALIFEIDKLKKELREAREKESATAASNAATQAKTELRRRMSALSDSMEPEVRDTDDSYVLPRPVEKGDAVVIRSLGKEAEVTAPADRKGNVEVIAGGLKMRVRQDDLRLVDRPADKKPASPSIGYTKNKLAASGDTRCDLRGMTTDEAMFVLDRFLDDMTTSGIKECTVIHGKGTGALRTAVSGFLKKHPQVKSFRLGLYGEGENGVTIVELK